MAGTRARAHARAGAALTAAVLVGGCGSGRVAQSSPADTRPRSEKVAAAWEGSAAFRQWRAGFHPLDSQDWQPPGGFRSGEDKVAYLEGNFVLRTELPADPPPPTPVRWPDGSELALPLRSAAQAYRGLDKDPDRAHPLPVTAVRFGEATERTSRGPARVPAWLFTVEGYDSPLVLRAIGPQELPKPPVEPLGIFDEGTAPLSGDTHPPADATSFTVSAGHGSCDAGAAVDVLEGELTVVLAGRILVRTDLEAGVDCDAMMHMKSVPVTLDRPLGDRILLDAATGAPLEYGRGRTMPPN